MIGFYAAGGANSKWSPGFLSPRLWLDDSTAVTDVSGSASQWNDKSANGWNMAQSTAANRPTIIASAINGRRALEFDGTSDFMATTAAGARAIYRNVSAGWAFLVFKRAATGSATRVLFGASTGVNSAAARLRFDLAAEKIRIASARVDGTPATLLSGATSIDTSWHAALITVDWATTTAEIHLDGVLDGSSTSFGTAGSTSNTDSQANLSIGSNMNGTEAFFDGRVACVIAGAGSLPTSGQRTKLFAWAEDRYGL
jgi:hypothetical protein